MARLEDLNLSDEPLNDSDILFDKLPPEDSNWDHIQDWLNESTNSLPPTGATGGSPSVWVPQGRCRIH